MKNTDYLSNRDAPSQQRFVIDASMPHSKIQASPPARITDSKMLVGTPGVPLSRLASNLQAHSVVFSARGLK